jgi:hypothetical protein
MIDESGRFRISQVHRSVALPLHAHLAPLELVASEVDGLLLVEGDIAVRPETTEFRLGARIRHVSRVMLESIGIVGASFRWSGATIPFTIQSGNTTAINDAIAHWHANTPIRLIQRVNNQADFVEFRASVSGSDSEVGRRGQRQIINLALTADVPTIIHEIGHAVGLWHEHTRDDRNQKIEVIMANIASGALHNFDTHVMDGDKLGTDYDFDSIMHYPPFAFAANPLDPTKPTIRALKGETFGQAVALSGSDIRAVRTMYP